MRAEIREVISLLMFKLEMELQKVFLGDSRLAAGRCSSVHIAFGRLAVIKVTMEGEGFG